MKFTGQYWILWQMVFWAGPDRPIFDLIREKVEFFLDEAPWMRTRPDIVRWLMIQLYEMRLTLNPPAPDEVLLNERRASPREHYIREKSNWFRATILAYGVPTTEACPRCGEFLLMTPKRRDWPWRRLCSKCDWRSREAT